MFGTFRIVFLNVSVVNLHKIIRAIQKENLDFIFKYHPSLEFNSAAVINFHPDFIICDPDFSGLPVKNFPAFPDQNGLSAPLIFISGNEKRDQIFSDNHHQIYFANNPEEIPSVLKNITLKKETTAGTIETNIDRSARTARRQQETELRESEKRFRTIFESSAMGIAIADPAGRFLQVNPAFQQMLGYTEAELQQLNFLNITHPDDAEISRKIIDELRANKRDYIKFEKRYLHENKSIIWANVSISSIKNNKGAILYFITTIEDITEKKSVETELLLFKLGFERSREAIFMTDIDGKIKYINPAFEKIYGYSFEEVIGKTPRILKSGLVEDKFYREFWDSLFKKKAVEVALKNKTKSGRIIDVEGSANPVLDENGEILGFLAIQHDVTDKKRAEESLKENQRTLATLMSNLPGMVYRCRNDNTWSMEFVSDGSYNLTGYYPVELMENKTVAYGKLIHPEDREKIWQEVQSALREKRPFRLVYRILNRKKEEKWVWEQGQGVYSDDGEIIALEGFISDITEQKKAEDALQESEEKFRNLADKSPNMIFINKNSRIVYVNKRCEELMGYSREEFYHPDFNFFNLVAPESREIVRKNYDKHQKGLEVEPYEYTIVTKTGSRINAIHTTKLINFEGENAIMGILTDITDRKKTEEALKESEERYRKFFEEDLTGDFISTPDGKLLDCNPAFARMLGYDSVEEILNSDVVSFYPNPQARENFINLLKEKKILEYYEEELRNRRNEMVYVIENVRGVFDEKGELVEIRGYMFDITDRKKLELQLLQSQKMEAIGRLAGGVAHDFNNLLTIIRGYSEVLLNDVKNDPPVYNKVEQIKKAGERATQLTMQLLTFSRKQIIQPRIVNLNAIISEMSEMLRRVIGEDIELITKLDAKLSRIKADPGQVEQIIMNLAVNSRDAMPEGGKLIIDTQNISVDVKFSTSHFGIEPGDYVMLTVSDAGVGMDSEILSHIFEPFFTTKQAGKGTGLGLSTVYGIVKQSNGYIWVYSEPGLGATFKIYFPAVEDKVMPGLSGRQEKINLHGSETILLVEDEDEVRKLFQSGLTEYGYKVYAASNGIEALEICKTASQPIHLVVTDMIMPFMNGRELAEKVRSMYPDMKIVYISGYTDDMVARRGIQKEGAYFLQKPFSPTDLIRKIRIILDNS